MKNARILLVEDDPRTSLLLEDWLRQAGAVVTLAASIAEAEVALGAGLFDLILSDVHLPGNGRLQWTERLLQADFPPPIVLLTGNPELETALRAANLPVAGYFIKPPDFNSLGLSLSRLIAEHRRRVELRALSREAAWLLATPETGGDDALRAKLQLLSSCLATEAGRSPRESMPQPGPDTPWRTAIAETVAVLEKTKDSFRSKELGRLRLRLAQMLARPTADRDCDRTSVHA